jgi:hypothetical protein
MLLLTHKNGAHQLIDRAADSYELRECSIVDVSALSATMLDAVRYATEHKALCRYPGGFWQAPGGYQVWAQHFGTATVEALVKRGVAAYTEWRDGRNGRFPVRCELVAPNGD